MKIFLIDMFGCKFPDIGYQVKAAFEQLGHDVESFNYRKWKLQHFRLTNLFLNKLMIHKVESFEPDIVLVSKGETLLKGTVTSMKKKGAKVLNWNPDEPFGHLLKFNKLINIEEYDAFFT